MTDHIEYTYYMITRPTRNGRRAAISAVYRTRSAARDAFMARWPESYIGEMVWYSRFANDGWRSDPVTVMQPKTAQGLPQNSRPDAEYHFCRGDCLADWANNTGAV